MPDGYQVPILRTSERGTFGECIAKHNWSWTEGLIPRAQQIDARWFGTGVHLALAKWYCGPGKKRGPHPAETWKKYCGEEVAFAKVEDATEEERAKYVDMAALGETMLNGYVETYGRDEHMHVFSPEQTFSLNIPWPKGRQQVYDVPDGAILTQYSGTYDLTYRDLRDDRILLEEHKTAKTVSLTHLAMDNQGGSYWALATMTLRKLGLIGPKESLSGIEYNFLRKGLPDDERPKDAAGYHTNKPTKEHYIAALRAMDIRTVERGSPRSGPVDIEKATLRDLETACSFAGLTILGERSKLQPSPLFVRHMVPRTRTERATQLRRIQDEAVHIQVVRDGLLPIRKTPGKHCAWCDFSNMCELQDRGGNWQDYKRLMFKARDVYADHRKSTEDDKL